MRRIFRELTRRSSGISHALWILQSSSFVKKTKKLVTVQKWLVTEQKLELTEQKNGVTEQFFTSTEQKNNHIKICPPEIDTSLLK